MLDEVGQDAEGLGLEPDGRASATRFIARLIQFELAKDYRSSCLLWIDSSFYAKRAARCALSMRTGTGAELLRDILHCDHPRMVRLPW